VLAVDERIFYGFGTILGLPQPVFLSLSFQSDGKLNSYAVALGAKAVMSGITDVGAQGHL
jgi:hypothetical protein